MKSIKTKIVKEDIRLLRPPRLLPEQEPPAYFGENYSDSLPSVRPQALIDFEVYSNDTVKITDNRDRALFDRLLKTNAELKKLIYEKEYRYFGAANIDQAKDNNAPSYVLYVFVYTDNYTVEVHLDKNLKEIIKVLKTREQPAPDEDEIEEVIEIARHDNQVAEHINQNMVGQAILLHTADRSDKLGGKRIFDVQFGYPEKRLPLYKALVDISEKRVVAFREIKQPDNHKTSQQ